MGMWIGVWCVCVCVCVYLHITSVCTDHLSSRQITLRWMEYRAHIDDIHRFSPAALLLLGLPLGFGLTKMIGSAGKSPVLGFVL